MSNQQSQQRSIFSTILNDVRTSQPFGNLKKESKEISDFYLSDEQRERLKTMRSIKRGWNFFFWVLKAMFFKLTPFRRLLFVLGIIFIITVRSNDPGTMIVGNSFLGGLLLVLVILLELKDKLLAHDELHEGRQVQESLMPERTPELNGWSVWLFTRSANEVCGDLIDFLRMENGRCGIAIADVAGKGLHAALLTTKLQATIRALAFEKQSLSDLVAKINTIFHRDSPSNIFASLLYCEFDESGSSMRFVNAGHLPALYINKSNIEEAEKGDVALGLVQTSTFTERTLKMNSGDTVILYSDGLTEAKNGDGNFFGKDRVKTVLQNKKSSPKEIGNTILREVDRFIGQVKPSDDLSLIILQKN